MEISERVKARLAVLTAHIAVSDPVGSSQVLPRGEIERWCTSSAGSLKGSLTIVDERTGKKYQVPVSEDGTVRSVDLKKITTGKDDKGLKLYDPGYLNTAPVRSSISYIDGDEGILRYRGYPIEELAESSTFIEVSYLLMYGNLPSQSQLADWEFTISQHSAVPQGVLEIIQSMPHDAHPMGVLVSAMSALSIFHPDANPALSGQDIYKSKQVRDKQIVRILGKAPTIAAAAYLRMAGRPPVLPSGNLSYAENFLYMLDSMGNRSYKPNPRLARVLDILFILHAEHEMNCSTAAARHLASSGVDVYTAVAGAVGALYGPLHGGANEAVLKMLAEIGSVENIPEFIEGVKNRKRKMSGFGHRVYKNYDPRAKVIKKLADEVFSIVGRDPLIEVAVALEKAALSDEYFVKRKLYPNVDFYSGLIYRAMGFPPEFFTVLFAVPRMAGYLSHWRESLDDPDTKIMRPQQAYTGVWLRHYEPVRQRTLSSDSDKMGQVSISNASRRPIEKAISTRNEKKRNEGLERWLQSFKEGIHQRITAPLPSTFVSNQELHQEDTQHAESVILPIQYVAEESEFIGSEEAEEKEHSMANKSTEIQGSISCYELIQPLVCNENSPVELLRCEDGLQHFVFEPGENWYMMHDVINQAAVALEKAAHSDDYFVTT
ncbi:hypothetical protein IGI04_037834 [Brassica rapa subsp. trilocularis]|uniref:Citrate synthase n=1 Tax=Brassica rapa subsp. trilocularis TaxID=1813537 RepID=A0ABQ7LIL4_BRACM|nr:hypothetical protein IGI04_037834 [Brassica rapa subsp. trilocularis]